MLFEQVEGRPIRRLAMVGIAKNAGKTTAMNRLIQEASRHRTLGIVSAGVDGERIDALTGLPKPAIWLPRGAWIATASGALYACRTPAETVRRTGIDSPLGEIVIARLGEEGPVWAAGVRTVSQLRAVCAEMEACGADLVLVDGAFDRAAAAAPSVTDAVILCTGAVAGSTVEQIVAATTFFLKKFMMPVRPADPGDRTIEGALTDSLLQQLVEERNGRGRMRLVLPDPTHCLLTPGGWRTAQRHGTDLVCLARAEVLALTANPWTPYGEPVPAGRLVEALQNVAGAVPVLDVAMTETDGCGGRQPCDGGMANGKTQS